jgi:hypothetical protein
MEYRIVAAGRCKKEVFFLWCVIFLTVWHGYDRNLQTISGCSAFWIKIEATLYRKSVSVYIYEHIIVFYVYIHAIISVNT